MTELESHSISVDIDGTLCYLTDNYSEAAPIPGAAENLKKLREEGWTIILFTARHFNQWQITVDWLKKHDFEYDQIVFGKPPTRYYIDDRAILFDNNWDEIGKNLGDKLKDILASEKSGRKS
ncbi:hypothetical protein K9N50_00010 [bacterium]|nr:hypothetical protein [bacterium]